VWTPESKEWNPESRDWNPESKEKDPESRDLLDYLTWGDILFKFKANYLIHHDKISYNPHLRLIY
jgi:hypothetical protein